MYSVMQQYSFDPTFSPALTRHIKERLVPLLRETPGFVAYYWFDSGDGRGASLGVYEDRASAEASLALASNFVRDHLVALVDQPETVHGEVKAYALCGL